MLRSCTKEDIFGVETVDRSLAGAQRHSRTRGLEPRSVLRSPKQNWVP